MEAQEFRTQVRGIADFIVAYNASLKNTVSANVSPNYLAGLVGDACPQAGVNFAQLFAEFQENILAGVTHWNSPHFHAYYPAGFSYASILGELLIAGLNTVDVNWEACPASVELEAIVLDWLAKIMHLPEGFIGSHAKGLGGGSFQTTSGESTLLCLVAAKNRTLQQASEVDVNPNQLIVYTSECAHFSVQRAGVITGLPVKALDCDSRGSLRGLTLRQQIENDLKEGNIPCCVVATLGTTSICSFDNIEELGPICKEYNVWLHVDAAYAGSALICPEFRDIARGLDYADSFGVGLHKWFCLSYDVVALWMKQRCSLEEMLKVDATYLDQRKTDASRDFRFMSLGTGRKFRSLKVWMVMKNYGLSGLQAMIRRHVQLGDQFCALMQEDDRFVIETAHFGVVTFRLRQGDASTKVLWNRITDRANIMLTPATFDGKYLIRFIVNYATQADDVTFAWQEILVSADL